MEIIRLFWCIAYGHFESLQFLRNKTRIPKNDWGNISLEKIRWEVWRHSWPVIIIVVNIYTFHIFSNVENRISYYSILSFSFISLCLSSYRVNRFSKYIFFLLTCILSDRHKHGNITVCSWEKRSVKYA